jgi:hypothetical protein
VTTRELVRPKRSTLRKQADNKGWDLSRAREVDAAL